MRWSRIRARGRFVLLIFLLLFVFSYEWPPFGEEETQLRTLVGEEQFDFLIWETDAFAAKANGLLTGGQQYLTAAEQKEVVLSFLEQLSAIQQLEAEIAQTFIDPDISSPQAASAEKQAQLAAKRATLAEIQPIAEAILQQQVATILVEEGFSIAGMAWPPVMMHMSPLPPLLVVSPRDRIERIHAYSLETKLTTPAFDELETAIYDDLDLSALVVPIGGMGTYPAMIMETTNLNWLIEVISHEWSHHWMSFHKVGWNYSDPEVRVINETIASLIDVAIAEQVIARYYPEFMPETAPGGETAVPQTTPDAPPPFDFRAEMAATRIRVDELLAEGNVEEAETYMEAQRQLFVENGYAIRKLNQAYFAFYGAYAARPGATGGSPIGPMLRDIFDRSPTLRAFMETVAPLDSMAALEAVWEESGG